MKKPESSTIEMKLGRQALQDIIEAHLNDKVFVKDHIVTDVITHKQGDFGVTVVVEPHDIDDLPAAFDEPGDKS